MISPHFVCLSMIVSGRYQHNAHSFCAIDGLAYAIERENECEPLPPLVERSVEIFTRAAEAQNDRRP